MPLSDLRLRVRALFRRQRVEQELDEELAFHVECETRKLTAAGLDAAEARRRALARFGPVPLAADQCRDARGTFVVEALIRDVAFAVRTLRRAPLVALTIVSTIALGLGVVTVAFTFFNAFLFQVDAVRNPGELYEIERLPRPGARVEIPFTRAEYDAIRRDTHVFAGVSAVRMEVATRIDGRSAAGMFVSGNFFGMLGVRAALGRTLGEADDRDGGQPAIVLSHRGWGKLFGSAPDVIGRSCLLNGQPYVVAGVMPEDFRGLRQLAPDFWAPLARLEQFIPAAQPAQSRVDIIARLLPDVTPDAAATALTAWGTAQPSIRKANDGLLHIFLRERRGVLSKDRGEAMTIFVPILFAFGLILMIGSANVANLLLARGLARQREIAVRLSLGASRARIVRQLLTESLLLAMLAAALGYVASRALFTGAVQLTMSLLPPEFAESLDVIVLPADWRVLAFLFGAALIATAMFGLVPALYSTRLELVRAMRGEIAAHARPGRVRQALIAGQVTASALLLVCAAVFLRGTYDAATADAALRTDDTVLISGITEAARPALLEAVTSHPSVAAVAASWPGPSGGGTLAEARTADRAFPVDCRLVAPGYLELLGIDLVAGRRFAPEERSAAAGVTIVSESVARRFWPDGPALGQTLRVDQESRLAEGTPRIPAQGYTVIGVARDVRSAVKLFNLDYAGIYLPATAAQPKSTLVVRVHGDPDAARRTLLDALTPIDPALGNVSTMRTMARLQAALMSVAFWMAVILGGLALALTMSGLFSTLSYLVEQRRTEIGVRLAIGATPRDIVRLVLRQSIRPIAIGVAIGGALAEVTTLVLLATPAARDVGALIRPHDPLAYAGGLTIIVATCLAAAFVPARRAARIDPMASLRAD